MTSRFEGTSATTRTFVFQMRQIRIDVVAKEQMDKFDQYVSSMTVKVGKQREERRKYNEVLQERLHEQEEAVRYMVGDCVQMKLRATTFITVYNILRCIR